MRKSILFFVLLIASSAIAQSDSVFNAQRDSSWEELVRHGRTLRLDSLWRVRWNFSSCDQIHKRLDQIRRENDVNRKWRQVMDMRTEGRSMREYDDYLENDASNFSERMGYWYQYMNERYLETIDRFPIINE